VAVVNYVGIDLGTTNSVICSYDGEHLRLYKSQEQQDVTPSAIFVDKRGNKYLGVRAYNNAARNPDNAALNFKRLMGTSTPISLAAVNLTLSPEECSADILKLLFGYLPRTKPRGLSSRFRRPSIRCKKTQPWPRRKQPALAASL